MSVIQEPGSTRPGRAAGLVLIAVAVIAVVIGVITLLDDGEDNNPGGSPPPPPSSTTGDPQQPPQQPPPPGSQTGQPTSQPTQPNPPVTTTTTAAPAPPPPAPDPKQVPVRVFNNSTISGFARQAAAELRADGWNVVEVFNYSERNIPTTTAYFRPGTDEEAAARALAVKCNLKVEPRFAGMPPYGPGVVVMITKDYCGK